MAPARFDVEVAVVGGGAVGLACAALAARAGRSVVLIERHAGIGQETSSRNSGVVHAGLYYPPGSSKATTCVRGRELLYARCRRDGIAHRRCGKLLVACDDGEREQLERLHARGRDNGAGALELIAGAEVQRRAPPVRAVAGLWSPQTGIVDAHGLMESYRAEARAHGADIVLSTALEGLAPLGDALRLHTRAADGSRFDVTARALINAAGLGSDRVAELAGLDVDALGYRLRYCKGDYFTLAPRHRGTLQHLIYPVPARAGLGIHLTLDLAGQVSAGPDTEYVAAPGYDVDPVKAASFAAAVRRYLPDLRDDELAPGYAGIRPKLHGPDGPPADFVIEEASPHGAAGLINLIGIESPGLTASEAIAERVLALL